MFTKEDYVKLLTIIEVDFKEVDKLTAYNLCRELSVIYAKDMLGMSQTNMVQRLTSMITYIEKALPKEAPDFVQQLRVVITKQSE